MGYYWPVLLVIVLCRPPCGHCDQDDELMNQEHTKARAPYFTDTPDSRQLALIGEDVKIPCKGFGFPKPFLVWYRNNTRIGNHENGRIKIRRNILRINKAEAEDSGTYSCHLFNEHGEKWVNYSLLVANETEMNKYLGVPPDELDYVDSRSPDAKEKLQWSRNHMDFIKVKYGQVTSYIELDCPAKGSPRPKTEWFKDGELMKDNKSGRITTKKWKLVIADLVLKDAGNYTCEVSNQHGMLNWTYELMVLQRAPHVPLFEQPKNQSVRLGETAMFSCRIEISDTHPHIQWLKHYQINGSFTNEKGEQYFRVVQGRQTSTINLTSPEILILANVTKEDEGKYTCLVRNAIGSSFKSAYLEITDEDNTTVETTAYPETTTNPVTGAPEFNTTEDTGTPNSSRHDFECHQTTMDVFIPVFIAPNSVLILRDPSCHLQNNGTHYVISFSYGQCGTSQTSFANYINIENEITVQMGLDSGDNPIQFASDYTIPLKCSINVNTTVHASFQAVSREQIKEQITRLADFQIHEYRTADYQDEITDYPVMVPMNREIFFELTLANSRSNDSGIKINKCAATPSPDPNGGSQVLLITNGCSRSSAVKVLPRPTPDRFRFSTQAFHFGTSGNINSMVYVHCDVSVCQGSSCNDTCSGTRRRRSARNLHSVSLTSGQHIVTA